MFAFVVIIFRWRTEVFTKSQFYIKYFKVQNGTILVRLSGKGGQLGHVLNLENAKKIPQSVKLFNKLVTLACSKDFRIRTNVKEDSL